MNRSLVRLRPLDERDVDDILGWVNDPEIIGNLAAFAGKPLTREDELQYVRRMQSSREDRVFTITTPEGRYLGQIGLHQIFRRSAVARLSVIVASRKDMGQGVGSAAIASLLDIAFGEEKLHKVWLMCFARNERARRTYARVGFVEEGVLREEYFHEGAWHDMVRMGMLAREWAGPASSPGVS
jgi:RimJ/RimL family protein N-acetyltransferase